MIDLDTDDDQPEVEEEEAAEEAEEEQKQPKPIRRERRQPRVERHPSDPVVAGRGDRVRQKAKARDGPRVWHEGGVRHRVWLCRAVGRRSAAGQGAELPEQKDLDEGAKARFGEADAGEVAQGVQRSVSGAPHGDEG